MSVKKKAIHSLVHAIPLGAIAGGTVFGITSCGTPVTFTSLVADGHSGTDDTTTLTLTTDKQLQGLKAEDISFTNTNIIATDLSEKITLDENVYTITISGEWANDENVGVQINKHGYKIVDKNLSVTLFKDETTHITLVDLITSGSSGTETTTYVTLTTSQDIDGLNADDISFSDNNIKATNVSGNHDGYIISLDPNQSDWVDAQSVSISINKTGFKFDNEISSIFLYRDMTTHVTLTGLFTSGSSGTETTTYVTLTTSEDIEGLDADDISFSDDNIQAVEVEGDHTGYKIWLNDNDNWNDGQQVSISVNKADYTITNDTSDVYLYKDTRVHVTFLNLRQIGGESDTKTSIALEFDSDEEVTDLLNYISFTISGITKETLTYNNGTYTIGISGTWDNNVEIGITIGDIEGYTIANATKKTYLYKDTTQHVHITDLASDGAIGTDTTTHLTFKSDLLITNLTADCISFTNGVQKGDLTYLGNELYKITVSGSWSEGATTEINFKNPTGYTIENNTIPVSLHNDDTQHVTIDTLQGNGSSRQQTTNRLTFNVSSEIKGLTPQNISFTNHDINGKDNLQFHSEGQTLYYSIDIWGLWSNGNETGINITNPYGFKIDNRTSSVKLYREDEICYLSNLTQMGGVAYNTRTTALSFNASTPLSTLPKDYVHFTNNKVHIDGWPSYDEVLGKYTVYITGEWNTGETTGIEITEPVGWTIVNRTSPVTLYSDDSKPVGTRNWGTDGVSGETTTTKINWQMDANAPALGINDIQIATISGTVANIKKEDYYYDFELGIHVLKISGNWINAAQISVTINKPGYSFLSTPVTITLYWDVRNRIDLALMENNGTSYTTTTQLFIFGLNISAWNTSWDPDVYMQFTNERNNERVFYASTKPTFTKTDNYIIVNLPNGAQDQFRQGDVIDFQIKLNPPGCLIIGSTLKTIMWHT